MQQRAANAASSYYLRRVRSAPDLKEFLQEAVAEIQDKGLVHTDLPLIAEHLPASHLLLADLGLPARLPVYRAAAINYVRGAGRSSERLPVYDPAALKEQMRDVVETYGLPRPPPIKKCRRFIGSR